MAPTLCSIPNCTNAARARGWCSKHYHRWQRYGDPLETRWDKGNPEANFWRKVDKTATCWLWTGYRDSGGYGHFGVWNGEKQIDVPAHRYAYELLVGPIPPGLHIDHVVERGCRHRHCVNPAHLEPVTPGENIRRGMTGKTNHANSRKTHCPQGHPYDAENTVVWGDGARRCRICERRKNREKQKRLRAKRK